MADPTRCRLLPALLLLSAGLPLLVWHGAGCGEVRTLETQFTPSLTTFTQQVQPVLDAQGCGRGPDEERGLAGCHTPEQGGLRLIHRPDEEQVVDNYRESVAFIDLQRPELSPLLLAPLNGPLPQGPSDDDADAGTGSEAADGGLDAGPTRRPSRSLQVDHPDYAGRFVSSQDCCYCRILLWICGDSTSEQCEACRPLAGCSDCQPVAVCQPGGGEERGEENAAAFEAATATMISACGGCHTRQPRELPPALTSADDVKAMVESESPVWLTPCQSGGPFLRYVDGNANDPLHASALDAEQRGQLHVWVEELGAPTGGGASCTPGGAGSPEEQAAFAEVVTVLVDGCGSCHDGLAPDLTSEEDVEALTTGETPGYLTPCEPGGSLLQYVDGNGGDPFHGTLDEDARAAVHRWIEQLGAPTF